MSRRMPRLAPSRCAGLAKGRRQQLTTASRLRESKRKALYPRRSAEDITTRCLRKAAAFSFIACARCPIEVVVALRDQTLLGCRVVLFRQSCLLPPASLEWPSGIIHPSLRSSLQDAEAHANTLTIGSLRPALKCWPSFAILSVSCPAST